MRTVVAMIPVHALAAKASPGEPGRTTLSNPATRDAIPESPYLVLRQGEIEAVVVDHRVIEDGGLPWHRAG
ncbi:hypothetical protein EP7_001864 [Isosphaeraceae bacterium EP7]